MLADCKENKQKRKLMVISPFDLPIKRNYRQFNQIFESQCRYAPFDPTERHITIEIVKSHYYMYEKKYIITKTGMLNCASQVYDDQIYIGRKIFSDDLAQCNHINIHPQDCTVSRVHCTVSFRGFFRKDVYRNACCSLNLLKYKLKRKKFPYHLLKHIFSYLVGQTEVCIKDCGSVYGTYIELTKNHKISNNDFYKLSLTTGVVLSPLPSITSTLNLESRKANVFINGKKTSTLDIAKDSALRNYANLPILLIKKITMSQVDCDQTAGMIKAYVYNGKPIVASIKDSVSNCRYKFEVTAENKQWYVSPISPLYKSISGVRNGDRFAAKSIRVDNGTLFKVGDNNLRITWSCKILSYN